MPNQRRLTKTASSVMSFFSARRVALIVLAASLVYDGFVFAAESTALSAIDAMGSASLRLALVTALENACLLFMYFAPNRKMLRWLVFAEFALSVFSLFSFPFRAFDEHSFLVTIVVPLALYEDFPVNFGASLGCTVVLVALRFFVLPQGIPERGILGFMEALSAFLFPSAFAFAACLVSNLRKERERLSRALLEVTKINLSYQDYAKDLEEKTSSSERLRLTRDIHDIVGYSLTNTIMMMEAAKIMARNEPAKLPDFIEKARSNTEIALGQIREMLRNLRRKEVDNISGANAIMKMVKVFEFATSIKANIDFGNYLWELGESESLIIYHFIQEGMLNAFRHGKAAEVWVSFWRSSEELIVDVRDNGIGSKSVTEGIGISGMRERLKEVRGNLDYKNTSDGFRITIHIPIRKPEEDQGAGAGEA